MGAEDGYASAAELTVASVRESVATAVVSLQGQLRKDLQEDELQIFSVLGRGGYGIVYHGTAVPPPCRVQWEVCLMCAVALTMPRPCLL